VRSNHKDLEDLEDLEEKLFGEFRRRPQGRPRAAAIETTGLDRELLEVFEVFVVQLFLG